MAARLDEKVCIVTGASSGIGKGIAGVMAKNGATVIVADLQEKPGKEACEEINYRGGSSEFYRLDVSNEDNWKGIIDFCEENYGKLDVLVNNAGIAFIKPILEMTLHELRRVLSVNLEGVFLGMKYAAPLMMKNGEKGGSIINISSNYVQIPSKTQAAYCASKSGVSSMTKVAALEFADSHIRVNTIYPGTVATKILGEGPMGAEIMKLFAKTTLAGRVGKPEDIAYAVVFLASDESEWVSGTDFIIDGGEVVRRTFYDDVEKLYKESQKV